MAPVAVGRSDDRSTVVRKIERHYYGPIDGQKTVYRIRSFSADDHRRTFDVVAEPLTGPPMHFHKYDEMFEALEGCLTFSLDGTLIEAEPGKVVVVPAGTYHSWINRGERSTMLRVTVPLRGYDETLFDCDPRMSYAEFCIVTAGYGSWIVGPPLVG